MVSFKSVYAEQGRTSCWLLSHSKISQSVCRTRNYASCWLYHLIIIMCLTRNWASCWPWSWTRYWASCWTINKLNVACPRVHGGVWREVDRASLLLQHWLNWIILKWPHSCLFLGSWVNHMPNKEEPLAGLSSQSGLTLAFSSAHGSIISKWPHSCLFFGSWVNHH